MIRLIAGISLDRAIGVYEGKKGKLPWGLKEARGDLALFRAVTDGDVVIMGRKTFESIGSKPLTNRRNIIVTSNHYLESKALTASSVDRAVEDAYAFGDNIWIMGGTEVFRAGMYLADEIFLTVVPFKAYRRYKPTNLVYFPPVDENHFGFRKCETHPINSRLRIIRYGTSEIKETTDDLRRAYEESRKEVRTSGGKKRKRKPSHRKVSPRTDGRKNPLVEALEDSVGH